MHFWGWFDDAIIFKHPDYFYSVTFSSFLALTLKIAS